MRHSSRQHTQINPFITKQSNPEFFHEPPPSPRDPQPERTGEMVNLLCVCVWYGSCMTSSPFFPERKSPKKTAGRNWPFVAILVILWYIFWTVRGKGVRIGESERPTLLPTVLFLFSNVFCFVATSTFLTTVISSSIKTNGVKSDGIGKYSCAVF
jgi:hypothetical protein